MFSRDLAVDLGTANTLVFVHGEGIVLNEPSIVSLRPGRRLRPGRGSRGQGHAGRTPGNIVAIRPLKDGVIADFDVAQKMLQYFIARAHNRRWFVRPRVVVSVLGHHPGGEAGRA